MANKQTLVANVKHAIEHLSRSAPTIARLMKEMYSDSEPVFRKFIDLKTDVDRTYRLRVLSGSLEYEVDTLEPGAKILELLESCRQLREEFQKAYEIEGEATIAMERFIDIDENNAWDTLSRSDILELRKLFKKDLRIAKLEELNMDELGRKWDEADIINKAEDCCAEMISIQAKLGGI
ncbi:unnamed protein product [Orchesella dallaii]|uniref:Uncharacterized protein n=1 Tax=Orchesella dallaii TaxID=48710 RepID=A0ABP1PTX2_9HEXA